MTQAAPQIPGPEFPQGPQAAPLSGAHRPDVPQDLSARVRLAANGTTSAPVLEALARDDSETVRAAVALNTGAPGTSHLSLARDEDVRVRDLLARKLGKASASLPKDVRARMADAAWQALSLLVADEAVRVRAALAEAVAEMADAPRDLILTLAHDTVIAVSGPVLRLSPLLTRDDLLSLIAAPPCPAAVEAVARRQHVSEEVTDAIVRVAGVNAVTALLSNPGSAIRETTLDALIARAAEQKGWHAPLVRRPVLSAKAALALSEIVVTEFLKELAARPDLPEITVRTLRERLIERMSRDYAQAMRDGPEGEVLGGLAWNSVAAKPDAAATAPDFLLTEANALKSAGRLTEDAVLEALRAGDGERAVAMLAVAAGVVPALIERATRLRSAKAVVALTWKAGFRMRMAGPLQVAIGRIPPEDVIRPGAGGAFPMTPDEMRWQLDFLAGRNR